ncbi:MAG: DNA-processing protein DprA [Mycobacteriales bacterium]
MSPVGDEERLARLALARLVEPGSRAVHQALQEAPATAVLARLRAGDRLDGLGQLALDGIAGRLAGYRPERDLQRLLDDGGRVLCPGDDEWPERLDWPVDALGGDVKDMAPPWVLFVRGPHDLGAVARSAVAVVGARAATAYGTHVAGELAFALAEAGVAVVSGGAYGVDGAAHRKALAAQGAPTVAVLACGVDVAYPRGHDRLLAQVAAEGLLVSEVPPGSAPTRVRFLVRNRVIAALTAGTVVVEAAARSGSLSTAGRAAELGRTVMAVPGPVTSALSTGCHHLLRSGKAVCVTGAADVLELVGAAGEHLAPLVKGPTSPRDGLDDTVRRVLDAVPVRSPVGVARIARTAGVSALVVQQVLPPLLVAGLVEQRDGAWRLTALGAGSARG